VQTLKIYKFSEAEQKREKQAGLTSKTPPVANFATLGMWTAELNVAPPEPAQAMTPDDGVLQELLSCSG